MASANMELVRSIYADWQRGDYSAAEWAHPDIEYEVVGGPDAGRWTGLAGMAASHREVLGAFAEFRIKADEYKQLDDERVLVFDHSSGRGRTSGIQTGQIRTDAANLFHIRGGKVFRLVLYFDRERAMADLGLSPEGGAASETTRSAGD
jgi:ketosteroid isomerase-like protein